MPEKNSSSANIGSKKKEPGCLLKIIVNIVSASFLFVLAIAALICAYAIQFNTFVDITVNPNIDDNRKDVKTQLLNEDKVIIIDNCNGLSPQSVPAQSIAPASVVVPLRDEANLPLLSGIGFQGASVDAATELLGDSHLDQIAKQHKENVRDRESREIPAVVHPEAAQARFSESEAKALAQEFSRRFPIGATTIPNLEVPPGHLNITTLRWQRKWEQGSATIKRPWLPYFELAKTKETLDYVIEVDSNLTGIETDQIPCDENLLPQLEQLFAERYKAGDENTARALIEQMRVLNPENEETKTTQEIIQSANLVGGIAQGQLKEGSDLAIRERPCFPGVEGDPTTNYKGALRDNEVVTVLGDSVPDECGYDLEWLYVRTFEGREGYVSAKYIIVPDFEIRVLSSETETAQR